MNPRQKRRPIRIPLVAILIVATATTHSASAQDVQVILDECRHTISIHKLQRQLDAAVDGAVESMSVAPAAAKVKISDKLRTLLALEPLIHGYRREFAELGDQERKSVQQWCLSTIGRKIIEAEEKESPDDDPADVVGRALASIRNARNPEARRSSIARLVNGTYLSALIPETIGVVAMFHLAAQELAKPEGQRLSRSDFLGALIGLAHEMQRDLTPLFEATIVDTYTDISDDDLAAYVLFLNSEAGKAWAKAGYLALHRYFKSTGRAVVDAVVPQ